MPDILGNFSKLNGDKDKRKVTNIGTMFSYSDVAIESLGKVEQKSVFHSGLLVKFFLVAVFAVMIFKLFILQVYEGDVNQKLAEGNRIRPRLLEATRGLIVDEDGTWLARNKASFALAVYPSDLPKKKIEREVIYNKIAELSGVAVPEIKKEIERNGLSSLNEVLIKENISHDEALLLEEKIAGLSGVFVAKKAIREYQSLYGLPHLLGYTGIISEEEIKKDKSYYLSDKLGKIGLEFQYENYLRGIHGIEQVEVDSSGNVVKILVKEENKEPVAGSDVVLNIDFDLQKASADALQKGVDKGKELTGQEVTGGAAIVMDVRTGAIKSLVSLPQYDNNLFATKISNNDYAALINDKSYPMFDRAVKGTYPPGSISKIILASAGLAEGVISRNTAFDTPAAIRIGEYSFPDWTDHGVTDIERAIAESNNIFFYAIGGGFDKINGIGIDKIKEYWQKFGLGQKTGIDLPGEADGLLPDPEWKRKYINEPWYIGDTYHVSIGQGDMLVTPLQMVRATAVIANGGKLLKPQIAKKIVGHDGRVIKDFAPTIISDNFLPKNVVDIVASGMRKTVTEGSARTLDDLPFTSAGKTGTAQFLNNQRTHAWFTCYAPYENPEIAVTILVDGGGGGQSIAAPVAKEILQSYFALK